MYEIGPSRNPKSSDLRVGGIKNLNRDSDPIFKILLWLWLYKQKVKSDQTPVTLLWNSNPTDDVCSDAEQKLGW